MTRLQEALLFLRSLRDQQARVRYVLARARRSTADPREVVSVQIPGLAHPVWLRAGGDDYYTFHQVFTELQYQHGLQIDPSFIVDAGANIGMAAVFFANQYPNAQIFSIEPNGENFEILRKNTAPYPNIRCLRGALWPTESALQIANAAETNPAGYTVQPADPASPGALTAYTPLSLLHLAKREHIDVFKIDIEGAELELFGAGSEQWLGRTGLLLVELHDAQRRGCGQAFFRSICRRQFAYFQRAETSIVQFEAGSDSAG